MAVQPYSDILNDVQWDDGLAIPVANTENKALEQKVQSKQQFNVTNSRLLTYTEERVDVLIDHMRNVRQELSHTQSLLNARKRETDTEDHMLKLAEREEGRVVQEIARLQKEMQDLCDRKNASENKLFRLNEQLDEARSQMKWDQQALEAWLEESARKDEDAMALAKYAREDEAKIKELTLKIEKMTADRDTKNATLGDDTTELTTTQLALDKTAEQCRLAHKERQQLIGQWEQTIDNMKKRDREMNTLALQVSRVKEELRSREEQIREQKRMLENQQTNNQEVEREIQANERSSAKLKNDLQAMNQERDNFSSELDAFKRTADRTHLDLEHARARVLYLRTLLTDKTKLAAYNSERVKDLRGKLDLARAGKMTAEEQMARLDQILAEEEQKQSRYDSDLKGLRQTEFKTLQQVFEAQNVQKTLDVAIAGSRTTLRNLQSRIGKLDHEALKQQGVLYNQEFELMQLERRLQRMQGEDTNSEEVQKLTARAQQLQDELDEKSNTYNLLEGQLKRLEEDIRRVLRDVNNFNQEKVALDNKNRELENHNENALKEIKRLNRTKKSAMVDENLMKLEVKRLRDALFAKSDDVLSLEERKLQLKTSMTERKTEIGIHMEMLRSQLRSAEAERQQSSLELHERHSKIDKLHKRFEILTVAMAPPDGEEERSQAYYVIKAAQEKEELQREGDELDARIRKAEKELLALENTVGVLNMKNDTMKHGFRKVTATSDEQAESDHLDEQTRALTDKAKLRRRQLQDLQNDTKTMEGTYNTLGRDEAAYAALAEEKRSKVLGAQKELDEIGQKIERARKQFSRQARDVRVKAADSGDHAVRDIDCRELRDFNKSTRQQLADISRSEPSADIVPMFCSQGGISLPTGNTPGSSRISSRSSVGSSRSSLASVRKSGMAAIAEFGSGAATPMSTGRSESSTSSIRSRGMRPNNIIYE